MNSDTSPAIPDFLQAGSKTVIGQYTFDADEIIEFASQFDPQRFHVDAEAAKSSLLGGLCASGWHTASVWMRMQRLSVAKETTRLQNEGKTYPEFGPSPGMNNLKWLTPVFVGDTITYTNTIQTFRQSNSRPQWHILSNFSEGHNQHGAKVIEFESTVFVKLHQSRPSS